jgi:hypothetical protein
MAGTLTLMPPLVYMRRKTVGEVATREGKHEAQRLANW